MFFPIGHLPPEQQEAFFKRLNEYRKKDEERLAKQRKNNLIKENNEKARVLKEKNQEKLRKEKEDKEKFNEIKRKEIMSEMVKNPPSTFSGIMAYGNLLGFYSN